MNYLKHLKHPEQFVPGTYLRYSYFQQVDVPGMVAGKTVLDIGAGTGFFSEFVLNKAKKVFALEFSGSNARAGSKLCDSDKICYIQSDAQDLPFSTGSVDVIFVSGVVEHVKCPEMFLKEAARVLKKDGIFISTVDVRPELTHQLYKLNFLLDRYADPEHEMLHKRSLLSDEKDYRFISRVKYAEECKKLFVVEREELLGGFLFNLIHCGAVFANKAWQACRGINVNECNYGDFSTITSSSWLMRFYKSYVLPRIFPLVRYKPICADAIYFSFIGHKKSIK